MNIIAQQLTSKPSTQAMLVCFLQDMKEYFKKTALLSEDKTYTRIFKMAETMEKYIPHFYCFTNITVHLINHLRMKIDDKFEDQKNQKQNGDATNENEDTHCNQDLQVLDKLQVRFSKQKQSLISVFNKGREVNQEFMRKLLIDTIDDIIQQINDCQKSVIHELTQLLDCQSSVLLFDAHLSNKSIVSNIAKNKNINVKIVKISQADIKNNQINLCDVASQIRKVQKVIISAESVLKNGSIIANSGSLMVALAARKYNIPVIILARGFSLTQKNFIDQHILLAENPMKFFRKTQSNTLKVFIGKTFDLIETKLVSQIVTQLGVVSPANLEVFFASYYNYI